MEFRNFGGDTGFMGELEGTGAAAGKVGYGYIKSVLDKYNVEDIDTIYCIKYKGYKIEDRRYDA